MSENQNNFVSSYSHRTWRNQVDSEGLTLTADKKPVLIETVKFLLNRQLKGESGDFNPSSQN